MNIAIFTAASALLLGLQKRRQQNQQDRDIKRPQHPVIRDRVVSMYPLTFVSFNEVLGAFPLACSLVFPDSKFIGYSTFPYSSVKNNHFERFVSSEMNNKFPKTIKFNEDNMYTAQYADVAFYKLNLKDKKTQWMAHKSGYKVDPKQKENLKTFLQMFQWSKTEDIIIEVNYSRSHAKGKGGFQEDKKRIDSIIKMLKSASPKLDRMKLYVNLIDACSYSGQRDVRLFITTFPLDRQLDQGRVKIDSFVVNLDPISSISENIPLPQKDIERRSENSPIGKGKYNVKETDIWNTFFSKSDKPLPDKGNFSRTGQFRDDQPRYPEKCAKRLQTNPIWRPYLLEDWRLNTEYPILRYFSLGELERLAGFPTGWISDRDSQDRGRALHLASNCLILQYILQSYAIHYFNKFKPGVYYA